MRTTKMIFTSTDLNLTNGWVHMARDGLFILDVGHGNCAVLVENSHTLVIDAGPGSTLLEFLAAESISEINLLLISHADEDHVKGIIALLVSGTVKIDTIRLNTDSLKGSKLWDDLVWALNRANKKAELHFDVSLTSNDAGKFKHGSVDIQILAPSPYLAAKGPGSDDRVGRRLESNSVSAVVRLVVSDVPVALLPGDIDAVGLANLIEEGIDAKALLVVFPHHGGRAGRDDIEGFVESMCDVTQAEIIVFSIGRGVAKTPRPEVVATIKRKLPGARVLCTQLSEHCSLHLPKIAPSHLADAFARGMEEKKCCAGTIVVNLNTLSLNILPEVAPHMDFIKKHALTALCLR